MNCMEHWSKYWVIDRGLGWGARWLTESWVRTKMIDREAEWGPRWLTPMVVRKAQEIRVKTWILQLALLAMITHSTVIWTDTIHKCLRHFNNVRYNKPDSLIGKPNLAIIASKGLLWKNGTNTCKGKKLLADDHFQTSFTTFWSQQNFPDFSLRTILSKRKYRHLETSLWFWIS